MPSGLDDRHDLPYADHRPQGILDQLRHAWRHPGKAQIDAELAAVPDSREACTRQGTAPSLATGSIRRGSRPGSAGAVMKK